MIKSECFARAERLLLCSWPLQLACVLSVVAACSNNAAPLPAGLAGTGAPPTGTNLNPVGSAGTTPGAAGSTTGVTGAAGTASGTAGATTGAAGKAAAGNGAAGTATAGSTSGTAGASAAGAPAAGSGGAAAPVDMGTPLKDCMNGSLDPCGSITTASGTKIPLGPYGSIMDTNVGTGFETVIQAGDADGGATCQLFASSFAEDPTETASLLDTKDLKFDLYTVYRPVNIKEGEKYPIITWGNGTCAQPEGYGPLLRFVASHGFFVVAANSRWVGGNSAMTKALDFMFAAAQDSKSPYFGKLDTTKVGAMGHSQGSGATVTAADDARVKSVILFNGGTSASKRFLGVSGERDIGSPTAASYMSGVNSSSLGAAFMFFHMIKGTGSASGHLTLMTQPERVTDAAAAWFKYTLNADADSKLYFVGTDCKLCNMAAQFDYGQKGL